MTSTSFTYLDQFKDIQVDLTPYLKSVKATNNFDYSFSNTQPIKTTLKNLFDRIEIVNTYKKNITFFVSYTIKDNEDLFILSDNFYRNKDLWWLICIFNDIKNVFNDWPLTEQQLQDIANHLYTTENKYNYSTYYNLLSKRNETKRKIIILREEYINDVIASFLKVYNS